MKNILIFNDFSPEAEHATELALLLAGKPTPTCMYGTLSISRKNLLQRNWLL
ncbi:MAG TPA: hypothetical protein VK668_01630 [Mucilaginibacter sp.]|nr:hypothetical protein [Mucilaginibacter sp.]